MKLNKIIRSFQFDKRLVEFNLNNNFIKSGEYKKYKDSLKDLSREKEELLPSSPPASAAGEVVPSSARDTVPSPVRDTVPSAGKEEGE